MKPKFTNAVAFAVTISMVAVATAFGQDASTHRDSVTLVRKKAQLVKTPPIGRSRAVSSEVSEITEPIAAVFAPMDGITHAETAVTPLGHRVTIYKAQRMDDASQMPERSPDDTIYYQSDAV